MTPTIAELRDLADVLGVDISGLTRKADIEAAIDDAQARIDDVDDVDDVDVDDVDDGDVDVDDVDAADDDATDVTPPQSPPTPQQLYTKTINSFRDPKLNNAVDWARYNAMVPQRPHNAVPRMVRNMDYATLELTVRTFTVRSEARKGNAIVVEKVNYDLPEDHGLSGVQLQDLLTAMITATRAGGPLPAWQDFV